MNVMEAYEYVSRHRIFRGECKDLSFGDTEVFLTFENNTDAGGGYFSRSTQEIWLTIENKDHYFKGEDANMLRKMIPLTSISRNDNGGNW